MFVVVVVVVVGRISLHRDRSADRFHSIRPAAVGGSEAGKGKICIRLSGGDGIGERGGQKSTVRMFATMQLTSI